MLHNLCYAFACCVSVCVYCDLFSLFESVCYETRCFLRFQSPLGTIVSSCPSDDGSHEAFNSQTNSTYYRPEILHGYTYIGDRYKVKVI